ncbi:MAG: hypothetical protein ONB48_19595 [candidate division KSB1 bacterium]|nr:hypothetical protein [candidate division KSB1 bacterium]MDZ7274105.1 hypothetical protein [candidate division KSB1 bacterium]MDZ7287851.1 hypothetical protein [candidate division KSB1 bacterium]MDZ7296703.1 hypothetical protein [candidate division KSB1 bacterium]MDZ7306927.1 hypothetical protein [candidate division KSB1 bacterium]
MIRRKLWWQWWMLAAIFPAALSAQTFSGRLTSSFYVYERSDSLAVDSGHARAYQTFQFDLSGKNVALRSYGQLDRDFSTRLAGDGKVRLSHLALEFKNLGRQVDLQVGRQPVFSGVAAGTIDGVQIKVRAGRQLRFKAFGGGLLPHDQRMQLIADPDRNYMAGGQMVWRPKSDFNLSLSFFEKRQLRPGYDALRADSIGNVFTQYLSPVDRAYRMASLDGSWFVNPQTSFYGRSDFNFHAKAITRAELAGRSQVTPRLSLTANYIFRSPHLPWNSLFAVFNVKDNHELEGGFYYEHRPALRFYGNVAGIFYEGEQSYRVTAGTDLKYGGVNYVHRSGYAGNLDGVNATLYYPTRSGLLLPSLQLSWASYKLEGGAGARESLYSGAAGLLVRPWNRLTLDGQVQMLHNRYYSNDVRLLFRMQYWFFTRQGASS